MVPKFCNKVFGWQCMWACVTTKFRDVSDVTVPFVAVWSSCFAVRMSHYFCVVPIQKHDQLWKGHPASPDLFSRNFYTSFTNKTKWKNDRLEYCSVNLFGQHHFTATWTSQAAHEGFLAQFWETSLGAGLCCLNPAPGGSTTRAGEAKSRLDGVRSRAGGAGTGPGHTAPCVWQGRVERGPAEGTRLKWLVQCCGASEENQSTRTSSSPLAQLL